MSIYYEGAGATLIHGDATRLTDYIEPCSVDLIITSPPYFALRSYQDGGEHYDGQIGSEETPQAFLEALWAVTEQCWQVLKPTGSLFVNLGDKYSRGSRPRCQPDQFRTGDAITYDDTRYTNDTEKENADVRAKSLLGLPWRYAIGCIDDNGHAGGQWILRAEIIWSKLNGLPESVTDRVRRNHEQWFHFTKEPRYFSAVDEIREEYTAPPAKAQKSKFVSAGQSKNPGIALDHDLEHNPLGKLPGSVWPMAMEPLRVPDWLGIDHFAAFPTEWPRRLILGWSPNGVCVKCGEGRRPVVMREGSSTWEQRHGKGSSDSAVTGNSGLNYAGGHLHSARPATITGYTCACDNTDAPTRPAVILDPFGGTGTVAMIARALGRQAIHVDLSRDYLKLAQWRIWESGHWKKAIAKTETEHQLQLFAKEKNP